MSLDIYICMVFIYMLVICGLMPLVRGLYARSFIKSLDKSTVVNNKLITYGRYRFKRIDKFVQKNYKGNTKIRKLEILLKVMRFKNILLSFIAVNIVYFIGLLISKILI